VSSAVSDAGLVHALPADSLIPPLTLAMGPACIEGDAPAERLVAATVAAASALAPGGSAGDAHRRLWALACASWLPVEPPAPHSLTSFSWRPATAEDIMRRVAATLPHRADGAPGAAVERADAAAAMAAAAAEGLLSGTGAAPAPGVDGAIGGVNAGATALTAVSTVLHVGGAMVHRLGDLLPLLPAFHSPSQLTPFGYAATRPLWSFRRPGRRVVCALTITAEIDTPAVAATEAALLALAATPAWRASLLEWRREERRAIVERHLHGWRGGSRDDPVLGSFTNAPTLNAAHRAGSNSATGRFRNRLATVGAVPVVTVTEDPARLRRLAEAAAAYSAHIADTVYGSAAFVNDSIGAWPELLAAAEDCVDLSIAPIVRWRPRYVLTASDAPGTPLADSCPVRLWARFQALVAAANPQRAATSFTTTVAAAVGARGPITAAATATALAAAAAPEAATSAAAAGGAPPMLLLLFGLTHPIVVTLLERSSVAPLCLKYRFTTRSDAPTAAERATALCEAHSLDGVLLRALGLAPAQLEQDPHVVPVRAAFAAARGGVRLAQALRGTLGPAETAALAPLLLAPLWHDAAAGRPQRDLLPPGNGCARAQLVSRRKRNSAQMGGARYLAAKRLAHAGDVWTAADVEVAGWVDTAAVETFAREDAQGVGRIAARALKEAAAERADTAAAAAAIAGAATGEAGDAAAGSAGVGTEDAAATAAAAGTGAGDGDSLVAASVAEAAAASSAAAAAAVAAAAASSVSSGTRDSSSRRKGSVWAERNYGDDTPASSGSGGASGTGPNTDKKTVLAAYHTMKEEADDVRPCVGHSPIHEWGLFAAQDYQPDQMIIEYIGELIRQKAADSREKRYEAVDIDSCYMFRIDEEWIVDATKQGNASRFINHSCDPNCYTRQIQIDGATKIVVFASRSIPRGCEFTYDYCFSSEEERIQCHCGTSKCSGRLN
jgi:hypothetical protein